MYFDLATRTFREENKDSHKPACVASDRVISWGELKEKSDKIIAELKKFELTDGEPVLIYGDKEAYCLLAILACVRMGFPFVTIDPSVPDKRVESIFSQTKGRVALKDSKVMGALKPRGTFEKNIAYILFTSGSTGQPKGVLISNDNLIAFVDNFIKGFSVSKETVFINRADLGFDISLADLFGALQTGGTAIFNTDKIVKDNLFFERINNYEGTHWNSTPSFVSTLLPNKDFNSGHLPSIQTFVLAGEDLSPTLVKEIKKRFPSARIINAYGPTETCIFASSVEITEEMLNENSIPISKFPAENIALENEEIIISGKQVGKGYLGSTAFEGKFHTGDLGLVKDGFLYYKGRNDEQIKFNGYRIELNEIKHALENICGKVVECLPIHINGKIVRLVAFVKTKASLDVQDLKNKLAQHLPAYMIPSEIIALSEFPLTASMKVDKKKLLEDYLKP